MNHKSLLSTLNPTVPVSGMDRQLQWRIPIARRPNLAPPSRDTGPRVNQNIRASRVRVIDHEGKNLGVMNPRDAWEAAQEVGLDLVEVSPNVDPPVCKILDYGKYKYELQKKAAEARKTQKTIDLKEVKFRPNIDTHDYDVKLRNSRKFLEDGDKLKVTLRFRGREMAHLRPCAACSTGSASTVAPPSPLH